MTAIHPQDQQRIEQLHGAASADIEERMISLQDASYELGLQRGLASGKELVQAARAAEEALRHAGSTLHADRLAEAIRRAA